MIFRSISIWVEMFKYRRKLEVTESDYEQYCGFVEGVGFSGEMHPNRFTLIYDYNNEKSLYASTKSTILDNSKKWELTSETFLKHIHSKDLPYLLDIFQIMLKEYLPKYKNNFREYILRYNCRVKKGHNNYVIAEARHRTIACDKNGMPWLSLVIINIAPENKVGPAELIHLPSNTKNQIFPNDSRKSKNLFTKREIDIAKLYFENNSTNDIAKKLNISIDTVNFHMKNIRKKTSTTSTKDAVTIAQYHQHL